MVPEDYEELQEQQIGTGGAVLSNRRTRGASEVNQDSHDSIRERGAVVSKVNGNNAPHVLQRIAAMPTQRQSKSSGDVQSSLRTLYVAYASSSVDVNKLILLCCCSKKKQPTRSKAAASSPKKKL